MDLFQSMSVYVRVVESGSMTAAALQCEMSTTMVGNHLRALEQRLGVQLLQRTTRRQRLTEFGSVYYQRCLEVLGLVADSERLAEQTLDEPRGILRVTAPLTFGVERLAPALSEFSLQCPQVKLDVILTNRRPDLLESGLDVAFRLGHFDQSNLIARPLIDYTLTVCASPEYVARRGMPLTPEELRQHDCLSFAYPAGDDWQSVEKQWRLSGPDGDIMVDVKGPMLINSSAGLHQAARTGMGIVMLPDALVEQDLRDGRLVVVMPDYQPPNRPMHLLYAPDRYRLPKLRRFVEFAMQMWGRP
ncbi:LysR family transcriptional regulator [Pseudomonas moraviensis]|uniref:DNA-binding transcriptional LysR family regulator n=1 Tax=Pseudomonas moraviensis TaxID=321662 RepID=A0A7Y9VWV1_9PSED|nr:LysR family transcriptional regulator [Pseudomonas moraviensis]NYH10062.1 DNA-binding transcriptional LysR family regulator [Pseudomonas moraviensis]